MNETIIIIKSSTGEIICQFLYYRIDQLEINSVSIKGAIPALISASLLSNVNLEEQDSRGKILSKYKNGYYTSWQGGPSSAIVEIQALIDEDRELK